MLGIENVIDKLLFLLYSQPIGAYAEQVSTSLVCLMSVLLFGQTVIGPFDFFMGVITMEQMIESNSMSKLIFSEIGRWVEAILGRAAPMTRLTFRYAWYL